MGTCLLHPSVRILRGAYSNHLVNLQSHLKCREPSIFESYYLREQGITKYYQELQGNIMVFGLNCRFQNLPVKISQDCNSRKPLQSVSLSYCILVGKYLNLRLHFLIYTYKYFFISLYPLKR